MRTVAPWRCRARSPVRGGTLAIGDNSVLQLDSAVASGQAITFGSGSELILNAPGTTIGNAISGLSAGDRIELNLGAGGTIDTASFSAGTVTLNTSAGVYQFTDVSLAAGASQQFSTGLDAATGDSYIQLQAPAFIWQGGASDNNYTTAANWQGGAAPGSGDHAFFLNNPGTVTGSGNALAISVGQAGTAGSGTWTFDNTTLTVAGEPNPPGLPIAAGFYADTVLNGGSLDASGGMVTVGGPSGVTVTAQAGASVTTAGDSIGTEAGQTGSLLVTGSGTGWTEQTGTAVNGYVPGFLTVGWAARSSGAVTVTDNASLNTGDFAALGGQAGSSGDVTVSAGGSWTVGGPATIGQNGAGTLTVNNGIVATSSVSSVGSGAGSSGTVSVLAGGLLTNSGGLTIGGSGDGSLTVDGTSSAVASSGAVILGQSDGATGTVSVTGGSTFDMQNLIVGGAGSGNLTVNGGALTDSGYLLLGNSASGSGIMNVSSATASIAGNAIIGNYAGTGTLTVGSGGIIQANGTFDAVGNTAGADGTLVIDNGGIFNSAASTFAVGTHAGSHGSMTINAAGVYKSSLAPQLSSIAFDIGAHGASGTLAAASGDVTVTGAGALLDTNGNPLAVGNNGGQGSLTVAQGGSVVVGSADSAQFYSLGLANSGGNGIVTVTDAGSMLTANGYLLDARGGSGTLLVQNGGSLVVNDAPVNGGGIGIGVGHSSGPNASSNNIGGTGIASVTGGGVLEVASKISGISVGGNGVDGQLNVSNGGTVLAGVGMTIGTATSSGGTLYGGTGSLNIGAGGVVKVSNPIQTNYVVVVGGANSSIGTSTTGSATGAASGQAVVSGTGALLDANGAGVAIGWLSNGSMIVSQGGSVSSGSFDDTQVNALSIGRRATGSLTITDAGSSYSAKGVAYVARAGNGSLVIENGGTLTSTKDPVGMAGISIGGVGLGISQSGTTTYLMTGGSGTALLTSGGSMSSQQWIKVGTDGTDGTLTVQNGSTAEAATQVVIGDSVYVANGDTIITPNGSVVSTGSLVTSSGVVNVGPGGTLRVDGAHAPGTPGIVLGAGEGANGALNVTGAYAPVAAAMSPAGGSISSSFTNAVTTATPLPWLTPAATTSPSDNPVTAD